MRGRLNSSITRVRPFFSALLAVRPSGEGWLRDLLESAPHVSHLPSDVRSDPGRLSPQLVETRDYMDRVLDRRISLPHCFEHSAPPSRVFLQWLIDHPDRLNWPERPRGTRVVYGTKTQLAREALIDGAVAERAQAQAQARAELERLGPEGSRRRWWAFEGHTEVDCWLETERLLLFVEGKRSEPLSPSTDWYPQRNQLVRNLEVVGELTRGRAAAVLLVTEDPIPELTQEAVADSTPHLNQEARQTLEQRYLGQVTWRTLCARLGADYNALPGTIADVIATLEG